MRAMIGRSGPGTPIGAQRSSAAVNPMSISRGARVALVQSSTVTVPLSSMSKLNGCRSPWHTTAFAGVGR